MIGMKVLGYERNPELLRRVPYIRYEDLAIVFIFVLKEAGIPGGVAVITSELTGLWGISAEELFAQARQSAPVLLEPVVTNIREMIGDCPEELEEVIDDTAGSVDMYILTNRNQTYGASALFYPGLLEKVTEYLGGGFYILPSSVHEVILIPEAAGEPDALRRMVREVNRCEVPEDMILSDNVYYYDPGEKQFRIV